MLYRGEKRTLKHSLKLDEIISTCVSIYKVTHCLKIIQGTLGNYFTYKNSGFTRLSNTSADNKINLFLCLFVIIEFSSVIIGSYFCCVSMVFVNRTESFLELVCIQV